MSRHPVMVVSETLRDEATMESRMTGNFHVRFGERDGETRSSKDEKVRPVPTLQMKGQSTDQGYALGSLVRGCDKTLALTGTIFGGRSTSLFFLLHRLSPRVRTQFKWNEAQRWAERYGILERVTKRTEGENGFGTYS